MRLYVILFVSILATSTFAQSAYVFVSFSMPHQLLIETLHDSSKYQIPAILNGLDENSFEKTVQKILDLTKEVSDLQLQIDPTQFERFNIKQVPALVVEKGDCFDVVYGNFSLARGLQYIAEKGECKKRGAS